MIRNYSHNQVPITCPHSCCIYKELKTEQYNSIIYGNLFTATCRAREMSVEMNCINDVMEMIFLLLTAFKVISAYLTLELMNYQKAGDKIKSANFKKY